MDKMSARRESRVSQGQQGESSPHSNLSSLFEPYVWAWFRDAFQNPSPPQVASWPRIARGKNTLIFSPTGSGKTLAAFLWCINELFRLGREEGLDDAVYVLYISPLKALNNDIQKNLVEPLAGIKEYAARSGVDVPDVRSAVRTGDTTASQRAAMARRPPHIFITTPESLYIILATTRFREAFRKVKYVIVDEIHAISDNKRGVHLSLSLERLRHLAGDDFVRIGLSATQRPLEEIARFLVGMAGDSKPRDCDIIDIGARKDLNVQVISPVDNLLEAHFDAIWGSAYDQMISLIRGHDTTLVFANSRYKTERTALRLNELSVESPVSVGAHHGSMSKEVRLEVEDKLKEGELDALVATSSLELGIDVGSINLVVQIQSPKSVSRGMQRIGRAGHLLDATSEGRLLVTDRDDLVESAVLVKAIMDGEIDTTRIPTNCLDVLAQQIVGAVAADDWDADELLDLFRHSYCYRDLDRRDFDRVLEMLSGNYAFDMEYAPYPKILWDKVNNVLVPERGARLVAFRASGTIPDVADYDVYFEERKTKVGRLDEGFVEGLRPGDVFILGSSSWRVTGIRRNRVLVEDVYGRPPTIPFWTGDRASRTSGLGALVGRFRREMEEQIASGAPMRWLQAEYYVDEKGARAICDYFREQKLVTGELPSDKLVLIEHFRDELGLQRIVIHSSFGIRVNDPWAMALCQAIEDEYGYRPQDATVDDGILITIPKQSGTKVDSHRIDPARLLELVTPDNLDQLLGKAVLDSPVFLSRFRHNAVRSLMVLREYGGRRTPVWLQGLRASALLEACRADPEFPVITETYRECMNEALDVPNLRRVLISLASGELRIETLETKVPSPFTHSLLLLGQYGDLGSIPTRERRSRLMHLHRELLRQILDEETLRNLLDGDVVESVDARLQRRLPQRRARNANELARVLLELGDLVDVPDDEISLLDRTNGDAQAMLSELVSAHRAVMVPIRTAETNRERWIATENFPLYRAAFGRATSGADPEPDGADRELLRVLAEKGPLSLSQIPIPGDIQERVQGLVNRYEVLRLPRDGGAEYVAAKAWIPGHILEQRTPREEARLDLMRRFMRWHGPLTKYEIMERYGFPDQLVERALVTMRGEGSIARGEYVPTKSLPQWCYKSNLEEIHRLTLRRLRREMEPATPEEYADFLLRRQHVHPDTQLSGEDGLRTVIDQVQGQENFQIVFERDVFPARVADYDPAMLDRLCYGGQVFWRRFDARKLTRGRIGFCFRDDQEWVVPDPATVDMKMRPWDDDIPGECDAVRRFIREHGACFFDDIVRGTGLDWRLVLRAVWHLVWKGEATNDSFESIRHAHFSTGLSACYDLFKRPGGKGATLEYIIGHMLDLRRLNPRLGRWAPTERLVPSSLEPHDHDEAAQQWAHLLLRRYGVVCRESLKGEVSAPGWRDLRRALVRLELLGKVRRGFFVQELSGEQYAYPEAVDALRATKLRHPDGDAAESEEQAEGRLAPDEPMVLVNACDPASPFAGLFPVTNEVGEAVKFPRTSTRYLVIQAGQPILLYHTREVVLLADLPKERAEKAVRALMQLVDRPAAVTNHKEINVLDWNGHPVDVSPVRHLLTKLGFVRGRSRWKGLVYDGVHRADDQAVGEAEQEIADVFERAGKEKAPVEYDAEWIISRSDRGIRAKVRGLIELLGRILPEGCELVYGPRSFLVRYKGFRCMSPYVQQRHIWLQITHKGWSRGIRVTPETDLEDSGFVSDVLDRFERTRQQIDALLQIETRPPASERVAVV